MRRVFLAAVVLVVAVPAAVRSAGPAFELRATDSPSPSAFVFPATPGSILHGTLLVTDTGGRAGLVRLYAADGTTGDTTGIVFLTAVAPVGVGTWITLPVTQVRLAAGAKTAVPFTIRVPGKSAPGQYAAGLVAEPVVSGAARNLSIVSVEVDVEGAQTARFTIGAAKEGAGSSELVIRIANDGNVIRKPSGTVSIRTVAGRTVETLPVHLSAFLPHTQIDFPLTLTTALAPGTYVASVTLTYAGTGSSGVETSTAAPQFTIARSGGKTAVTPAKPAQVGPSGVVVATGGGRNIPWRWVGVAAAALLAVGGIVALVLRRRRPETVEVTPLPSLPQPQPASPPRVLCTGFHYWEVDWDHPVARADGTLTYLHRCRNCGVEVQATDIGDASAKAGVLSPG